MSTGEYSLCTALNYRLTARSVCDCFTNTRYAVGLVIMFRQAVKSYSVFLSRNKKLCMFYSSSPSDSIKNDPSNSQSTDKFKSAEPSLPDYNTDVNVHEHKLTRPKKPSQAPTWTGIKDLKSRVKGSLIPETLQSMENDEEFQITAKNLKELGQKALSREERKRRKRALDNLHIPSFHKFVQQKKDELQISDGEKYLRKKEINIMQLNIGILCNQACNHCHVESSPKRTEMMSRKVADKCLDVLAKSPSIDTVDITGGAPELCQEFRYLVKSCREMGRHVIDRCNLTVLLEPGQEDLADFLASNNVHVIASLPCYTKKNVNMQRGQGVFDRSIQALLTLNTMGFGKPGSDLQLDLVYNPLGAYLPPKQDELEVKYKEELLQVFGITFNKLYTFNNFPIKRFADFLFRRNELESYMQLLVRNFNVNTLPNLMCYNYLNVDWSGMLYDCDLNQQLLMGIKDKKAKNLSIFDINSTEELHKQIIQLENHCYACTAGMGAS